MLMRMMSGRATTAPRPLPDLADFQPAEVSDFGPAITPPAVPRASTLLIALKPDSRRRSQHGVKPGSDQGQTRVKRGSDQGQTPCSQLPLCRQSDAQSVMCMGYIQALSLECSDNIQTENSGGGV